MDKLLKNKRVTTIFHYNDGDTETRSISVYDENGYEIKLDEPCNEYHVTLKYDDKGKVIRSVESGGTEEYFVYKNDLLILECNIWNRKEDSEVEFSTSYVYDSDKRLIQKYNSDGTLIEYKYNDDGKIILERRRFYDNEGKIVIVDTDYRYEYYENFYRRLEICKDTVTIEEFDINTDLLLRHSFHDPDDPMEFETREFKYNDRGQRIYFRIYNSNFEENEFTITEYLTEYNDKGLISKYKYINNCIYGDGKENATYVSEDTYIYDENDLLLRVNTLFDNEYESYLEYIYEDL